MNHTSLFNFCFAGTLDHHQGAKAYQLASQQFILHRTVQYRDPQCLILDGTSLLIISTAGPQGENKGSAQRALVALNHTAARRNTWQSCQFKGSNEIQESLSDKQEEVALITANSLMCVFPQFLYIWWYIPERPLKLRNSFVNSLSLCKQSMIFA